MDWFIRAAHAGGEVIESVGLKSVDLYTWLWCVGVAALGGTASWYQNVKAEKTRPFNVTELIGELFISAFVGVLTMLACKAAGVGELWMGVLCGITGHMGSRAIMIGENILTNYAQARAGKSGTDAKS